MDMTFSENYLAQFEEKLPIFHVEKSNKVKCEYHFFSKVN
jgi:hypothetical protein